MQKVSDETLFITYGFTKLEGCLWSSLLLPDYGNYAHAITSLRSKWLIYSTLT